MDNQGINKNVAFLNITFETYSKLENALTISELYSMILDKDPLLELYNCGNRYSFKDEILELNKLIDKNNMKDCKCLKKNQ